MDNENVFHIDNGILFSCKKNEIITFAGKWKELENILSEEIQTQKDKHFKFSYLWLLALNLQM